MLEVKTKLKINTASGIVDIVNTVLVAMSWFVVLFSAVDEATGGESSTTGSASFFYVAVGVGLVLHIIGLVKSKKVGISITGHILGIVGSGLFLFSMAFALPTFVLLILSSIFTLMQKNVDK